MSLVNHKLGKYVLTERLGQGGMAEVYKAYQSGLERYVAIKVMHRHLIQSTDMVTRFQREAKSVGQLQHRHILQVIDFDVEADIYYLVMEYIQGATLADYLARKKALPVAQALHIAAQLVDALNYAHQKGVIHRDIKPANIMLRYNDPDQMVLTDFGLVHLADETNLTAKGTLIGTPAYMAPEAFRGEPLNVQSDIYSLGVVLYQMVTGSKPYSGDTPYAIISQQIKEPLPPPRQFNPELPDEVEQLILKALAKNPKDRFRSAAEFHQAIQHIQATLNGSQPSLTPLPPPAQSTVQPAAKFSQWLILAAGAGSVVFFITLAIVLTLLVGPKGTGVENAQAENAAAQLNQQGNETGPIAANPTTTRADSGNPSDSTSTGTVVESDVNNPSAERAGMIEIPAGHFLMGSKFGEPTEQPEHDVRVDGFYIDRFEVTNADYRACVTAENCTPASKVNSATVEGYRDNPAFDNYPVVGVSWDQAITYCQWVGKRLPTEAEWEFAASGADNRIYPWGNEFVPALSAAAADDLQPVDSFPQGVSPFGVYQMAGNAGEWVLDIYDEAFYQNSPVENPFSSGSGNRRIYRGGTFGSTDPGFYTTSRRFVEERSASKIWIGFRCAQDK
ncbi:MAG: SUMF1/EgtB/PvdO family nonheme iron enzyme [Anaerolineae bacterium]|nr:SUMF1/EgtB/PvdO family nonheme iron enzyme [Anaerolineae bacterium]